MKLFTIIISLAAMSFIQSSSNIDPILGSWFLASSDESILIFTRKPRFLMDSQQLPVKYERVELIFKRKHLLYKVIRLNHARETELIDSKFYSWKIDPQTREFICNARERFHRKKLFIQTLDSENLIFKTD